MIHSFFDSIYPRGNTHELTLDWFLSQFKELVDNWEHFYKTITSEWDATKNDWNDLYHFVHDYFDNLDVQNEIDNKINEMYESGELAILLANLSTHRRNVVHMGVDNTGATDVSLILNHIFSLGGAFYLPSGTYLLEHQLLIPSNVDITGDGDSTILLASPNLDAVYHTVCSENAADINARLCKNDAQDGYPNTSLCDHYVENVRISNLLINGNWQNRDLDTWDKYYEHDGYSIEREPGTNMELQRVRNVRIENVSFINGIQHNFNVRAAAYCYRMGLDYVALYPSYNVLVKGCYANNQRYDDGFTTHDSEYIWIEDCIAEVTNNMDETYSEAISNGFEIDDGSRHIVVSNCTARYSLCGFQAKGHVDTPSAYDVVFDNCTAQYTREGFSLASSKSSGNFVADDFELGRCHNIKITNCSVLNPYPFANCSQWVKSVRVIDFVNVLDCVVSNLFFDPKRPTHVQNKYHGDDVRTLFNFRSVNYNITLENIMVSDDIIANYPDTAFFTIAGTSGHIILRDIKMKGYTGVANGMNNPIVKYNGTSFYNYLTIDGLYAKRLNDGDKLLRVSDLTDWSQFRCQGSIKDMIFYNDYQSAEWGVKYGFNEIPATGLETLEISPLGGSMYIVSRDITITLTDTNNIRTTPFGIMMSGSSPADSITVNVVSVTQPEFNISKTLHKREYFEIGVTHANGLWYK